MTAWPARQMHPVRGFTLIELLVALAIFAVMAAMAYGGLISVLDTRHDVDQSIQRIQTLQTAIFRIRSDLGQSVPRTIRGKLGGARPALFGDADHGIMLTRSGWRNPLQTKRSHLQRVTYRLNDDDQLVRLHWLILDRAQDSQPVKTVLLDDVEHIEWRYLDAARQWVPRWPPVKLANRLGATQTATARMPLAVELRIKTKKSGKIHCLFAIPAGGGQ